MWSNLGINTDVTINSVLESMRFGIITQAHLAWNPTFPSNMHNVLRTDAIQNPLWEILESMSLQQQLQNLTSPCYLSWFQCFGGRKMY